MPHRDWPPVYGRTRDWPPVNPNPAELRTAVFIQNGSIQDQHIAQRGLSPTKAALIGAKVYLGSAQMIQASTDTPISFDTEVWDQGSLWASGDPTKVYLSHAGIWSLAAAAQFAANATGNRRARILHNGTNIVGTNQNAFSGISHSITLATLVRAAAGDSVQLEVRQTSGGGLDAEPGEASTFLVADYRGPI